jgi:DNA mismatch repair ATPase MutS
MINRSATSGGNAKLADWLKEPATVAVIRERQSAVIELGDKFSLETSFSGGITFCK